MSIFRSQSLALILLLLAASPAIAESITPLSSTATVQDASAIAINPAALGLASGIEVFAARSINGLPSTYTSLTLNNTGYFFENATWQGLAYNQFGSASGVYLGYGFSIGSRLSYLQFFDPTAGNTLNWGASVLYRPNDWLSFGAQADNLLEPVIAMQKLARTYNIGVGFRPFGDRLTTSLDLQWIEGMPLATTDARLGLQAQIIPGMILQGIVNNQLSYSLGLHLQFGQLAFGGLSGVSQPRIGSSDLIYASYSSEARQSAIRLPANQTAYIALRGNLRPAASNPFESSISPQPAIWSTLERLRRAKDDPMIQRLVIEVDELQLGLAEIEELRGSIQAIAQSGKPVTVYLEDARMGDYILATAGSEIVLRPNGSVTIPGLALESTFFKGVLDSIGIEPQFVAIGEYKSAPEVYTRKGFTDSAKENWNSILDQRFQTMVSAIAQSRKMPEDQVKGLINQASFVAPKALEHKLVDRLAYLEDIAANRTEYRPAKQKPNTWRKPDVVAVVHVEGTIMKGRSGQDFLNGQTAGSVSIAQSIADLKNDEQVKAVVIRVESPGGSATGSDDIARAIDSLQASGKPVLISMGNYAASGGYWISATGARVYADPNTITGSIGVFSGRFSYGNLLGKIGLSHEVLKRGDRSDINSSLRVLDEEEVKLLRSEAQFIYDNFLHRVSKGRQMEVSTVDKIARGRIWSGKDAVENKLVDQLGGLEIVVAEAFKLGKVDREKTALAFYPSPPSPLENLTGSMSLQSQLAESMHVLDRMQRWQSWAILYPPSFIQ